MPRSIIPCTIAALALAATSAHAAEFSDKVKVRGFGTLGFTHSTEEEADFTTTMQQAKGPGATDNWGFGLDSKVGLQVDAVITDKLSAVVQTIVKEQYDGEFRPSVEWANLSYAITSDLKVRAGRIVAPTLMYSDSLYVGYSYLWARPPADVYYGLPFTNLDGVDVNYNTQLGNVSANFQGSYGRTEVKFPGVAGASIGDVDVASLNAAFESGDFGFRLGVTRYELEVDTLELVAERLRAFGMAAVADNYFSSDPGYYYDLGATYDDGSIVAAAEVTISRRKNVATDGGEFGYLSLGYRVQEFTPFAVVGFRERDLADELGAPYPLTTRASVNAMVRAAEDSQVSYTFGSRWDFAPGKALKLQATHTRPDDDSASILVNATPAFERGRSYNLYSLNLDFVF